MAFQKLNVNLEKVVLQKYFIGVDSRVSREVLDSLAQRHSDHALRQGVLYTSLSPVTDEMLLAMRVYLLKSVHTEKETLSVSVPATWFDHLKRDWLESGIPWKMWIARRLSPPKSVTESRTVDKLTRVCPHHDSYMSESTDHIEFLMWKNSGERDTRY
jgi:hypothetical protein